MPSFDEQVAGLFPVCDSFEDRVAIDAYFKCWREMRGQPSARELEGLANLRNWQAGVEFARMVERLPEQVFQAAYERAAAAKVKAHRLEACATRQAGRQGLSVASCQ